MKALNISFGVLLLGGLWLVAQPSYVREMVAPRKNPLAATCAQWVAQEIDDDFWATQRKAQLLRITNTVSVCRVDVKLSTGGAAVDRWFGFWNGATADLGGTNTQYGQWVTNSVNAADVSPAWATYTFNPPVELTADAWLCEGTTLNYRWRSSTTNTYESTSYYVMRGSTTAQTANDFCFRIFTR